MLHPRFRTSPPWRQPPLGSRARINWAHPLTTGLIFATIGSQGMYELVRGVAPTHVGGNKFRASGSGTALVCETATNNFTHWGSHSSFDFTETSSFSTFSIFGVESGDATARAFPTTRDTGSGNRTLFQWTMTTNNTLRLVFGNTLGTLGFRDGTTAYTASPNKIYSGGGVRDVANDAIRIYGNGLLETNDSDLSTGTWTVSGTIGSALISNPASTGSFGSLMSHLLDLTWNRALSNEEMAYLHYNPYSMFTWEEADPLTALTIPTAVNNAGGTYYYYH